MFPILDLNIIERWAIGLGGSLRSLGAFLVYQLCTRANKHTCSETSKQGCLWTQTCTKMLGQQYLTCIDSFFVKIKTCLGWAMSSGVIQSLSLNEPVRMKEVVLRNWRRERQRELERKTEKKREGGGGCDRPFESQPLSPGARTNQPL